MFSLKNVLIYIVRYNTFISALWFLCDANKIDWHWTIFTMVDDLLKNVIISIHARTITSKDDAILSIKLWEYNKNYRVYIIFSSKIVLDNFFCVYSLIWQLFSRLCLKVYFGYNEASSYIKVSYSVRSTKNFFFIFPSGFSIPGVIAY